MHRDVKTQNILISEDGSVKLCDLEVVTETDRSNPTKSVGTNGYMAPELNDSNVKYSEKIDMWSLGIVILQIFSKFGVAKIQIEKTKILVDLKDFDEFLHKICLRCLETDPEKRISAEELINYIEQKSNNEIDMIVSENLIIEDIKSLELVNRQKSFGEITPNASNFFEIERIVKKNLNRKMTHEERKFILENIKNLTKEEILSHLLN